MNWIRHHVIGRASRNQLTKVFDMEISFHGAINFALQLLREAAELMEASPKTTPAQLRSAGDENVLVLGVGLVRRCIRPRNRPQ